MENYQGSINQTIKNLSKGVGIALLSSMILLLIFSAILTYTNVSENTITPVIIIITAICILLRKFTCQHEYQEKWNDKWWIDWWNLYFYSLSYLKYIKLEIWIKYAKYYYDNSWYCFWDNRWHHRSE